MIQARRSRASETTKSLLIPIETRSTLIENPLKSISSWEPFESTHRNRLTAGATFSARGKAGRGRDRMATHQGSISTFSMSR